MHLALQCEVLKGEVQQALELLLTWLLPDTGEDGQQEKWSQHMFPCGGFLRVKQELSLLHFHLLNLT